MLQKNVYKFPHMPVNPDIPPYSCYVYLDTYKPNDLTLINQGDSALASHCLSLIPILFQKTALNN